MTGFGTGEARLGAGRVALEARSVNHRFLEVRVRMPRELADHGTFVEQLARARLSRGRFEINVRTDGAGAGALALDKQRALDAIRALTEVRDELGLTEPVPLSVLASIPDLFILPNHGDPEPVRAALERALVQALGTLDAMRADEGRHLTTDLTARLAAVEALADEVSSLSAGVADRQRRRLRERIARLVDNAEIALDPGRLELEVAILADHADVTEELTRLASHCRQFGALLAASEPVGRRMDFLLQEMAREVNTIGSKANEADVAFRVVTLKAELEKMREQVQNVE